MPIDFVEDLQTQNFRVFSATSTYMRGLTNAVKLCSSLHFKKVSALHLDLFGNIAAASARTEAAETGHTQTQHTKPTHEGSARPNGCDGFFESSS